ncbi:hypothetical protein FDP41_012178 [Naegleria fowleri]|uniref:DUF6606 domain-containing protein n=1 Tax=Naegleria fowleri TaxID=5763 RepID=A0A6A5C399_NAEFO|nr:uncharacterized protein FDP41_012178 [Naegleria fowleri]KAF0981521.1 hypothetical protein FDP41_012178 [Naegleria fowleri]
MMNSLLLEIFFFKKLPLKEVGENCDLLRELCDFMDDSDIVRDWKIHFDIDIHSVQRTFENWRETQTSPISISIPVGKTVFDMLRHEQDILPFYLPGNNSCLVLKKAPSHANYSFIATAFQIHAPNNIVMEHKGYPVMTVPEMSVGVYDGCLLSSQDFINQLQSLCMDLEETMATSSKGRKRQTEVRDVASPKLIFDWLLPTLTDCVGHVPVTTVQKKIRNSIEWKDSLKPYRRSGLWMCIKTCLQLNLVWSFGMKKGTLLYKIFMLRFMSYLCSKSEGTMSFDLVMQMLSKLSVRLAKLESMIEKSTFDNNLVSLSQNVMEMSLELIHRFKCNADDWWKNEIDSCSKDNSFPMNLEHLDVRNEIDLSLPNASKHLKTMRDSLHAIYTGQQYVHKPPKDVDASERNDFEYLCEIEDLIRKDMLKFIHEQKFKSKNLFEILEQYHIKATNLYENDPVGKSRFFLNCF